MPVSLNCAHCGVLFATTKQQAKEGRKYCSSTCYRAREKVNGPRKLVEPVAFACKQCGNTFHRDPCELASYRKKFGRDPFYCSTTCSGTGRSTAKDKHCKNCGAPIQRRDGARAHRRVTCSQACQQALKSKAMRAAYAAKPILARPARHGYLRVSVPDPAGGRAREVLEHRYVMEQHIGRRLTNKESVHHINGVKTDNRIENLELFDSRHGPGQRVVDQIAFAKQILADYAEIAEKLEPKKMSD